MRIAPVHPGFGLPEPRFYFPLANGRYEVKAGLLKLGTHEVHGRVESHVFHLDAEYPRFLETLRDVRRRGLHRRYQQAALAPALRRAFLAFAFDRLAFEWPEVFAWDARSGLFENHLTGWQARLDVEHNALESLQNVGGPLAALVEGVQPIDALDFLRANVPEDLSLLARDPETGDDWLAMLHVCCVHHWDPRNKVGRSFVPVHAPVGGIQPMLATASKMVRAVIEQGPYLRFAWGLAQSDRLSQHPDDPPDGDRTAQRLTPGEIGRTSFLRVERQVLWGFPQEHGALFTIRPYFYPLAFVASDAERRTQLASALRGMTPEQLQYKGMEQTLEPTLAYLEG